MVKRIHTNQTAKVVDKNSPCFSDVGVVVGAVSKPVDMRLRNCLQVRLDSKNATEIFLPGQLEVIP